MRTDCVSWGHDTPSLQGHVKIKMHFVDIMIYVLGRHDFPGRVKYIYIPFDWCLAFFC